MSRVVSPVSANACCRRATRAHNRSSAGRNECQRIDTSREIRGQSRPVRWRVRGSRANAERLLRHGRRRRLIEMFADIACFGFCGRDNSAATPGASLAKSWVRNSALPRAVTAARSAHYYSGTLPSTSLVSPRDACLADKPSTLGGIRNKYLDAAHGTTPSFNSSFG